ncbi:3-hydroxybutyryl-CoA dehydratase [Salpingoeca rosetta]|uniref:3-hydroxybutyryl-CoA dehydratase n=1 Tax=Salpingoeca rosetta (strain ATCC 50818 / BSB-021) TaxID=946362 RepID=F2UJE9_SALR5|nr:3-hydroxybutyryl-CoA dehydratase [Salpingoeca rosetta]EGD77248.1 3-hydroxybutyryl-CoA dehydratase [Salpingoeca rosetta]|eukprot:XP_004990592.1 3-hydroxybutyryl-CoA dehydratase [Salpingoeca rosetta]
MDPRLPSLPPAVHVREIQVDLAQASTAGPFEHAQGAARALAIILDTPAKRVNVLDEATVRALGDAVTQVAQIIAAAPAAEVSAINRSSGNQATTTTSSNTTSSSNNRTTTAPVVAVVFCSGKPDSFCHGGDVKLQQGIGSEDDARAAVASLKRVLQAIEDLPVPTICYINSVTLGGGLELALACDYRFAADTVKQIGLPEVNIGLLPGAGGCVRLPRLIGLTAAMQLILPGKLISAHRAKKLGVITDVVPAGGRSSGSSSSNSNGSRASAHPWTWVVAPSPSSSSSPSHPPQEMVAHLSARVYRLRRLGASSKYPRHVTGNTWLEKQIAYSMAVKTMDKTTHRLYPAPYRLLDVVMRCWDAPYTRAFDIETEGYVALVCTHEAKALMSLFAGRSDLKHEAAAHFHATDTKTDTTTTTTNATVDRVLVLGAGHMGGGLGQHLHACGAEVLFFDAIEAALPLARKRLARLYMGSKRRPRMSQQEADQKVASIFMSTDLDACLAALCEPAPHIRHRVVLECSPEDIAIKHKLIAKVLSHDPSLIFASNTSSIPIHRLAAAVDQRLRTNVIGFHFFHPEGNITPVVEIIPIRGVTSNATGAAMVQLAGVMKKVPVVVGDAPAFLLNRMSMAWYATAGAAVVLGGASVQRIDGAMKDAGCITGPFAVLDSITFSTAIKVCECMMGMVGDGAVGGRYLLHLLQNLQMAGCTGRVATGDSEGFYLYRNGVSLGVNPKVKSAAQAARVRISDPASTNVARMQRLSTQDATELLLFSTVNQACDLLDSGVAASARDVDMLAVLAMGILPRYGGIMAYADVFGPAAIVERLEHFKHQLPHITISPYLRKLAKQQREHTPAADSNAGSSSTKHETASTTAATTASISSPPSSSPPPAYVFRPDLRGMRGPPSGAGRVSSWSPAAVGAADAAIAAAVAAASAWLIKLTAKL